MTRARKELINLDQTSCYHLINRCVRKSFLTGFDAASGKDYSYRREWILQRIKYLTEAFAIDVAAYAIMSNHYHLVVKVDLHKANNWSIAEVVERWKRVCKTPGWVAGCKKEDLPDQQLKQYIDTVKCWRQRLSDISWFMKTLNEYISRRANDEDKCRGHFWESRYKSQALLDSTAILSCMMYVDLNPIRAGLAGSLEQSDFTSIKQRLLCRSMSRTGNILFSSAPVLLSFQQLMGHLQFKEHEYIELLRTAAAAQGCTSEESWSQCSWSYYGFAARPHWMHMINDFSRYFGAFAGKHARCYPKRCINQAEPLQIIDRST